MTNSKNRLDSIRALVNELLELDGKVNRREAHTQLNGVSAFASMLAMKSGLDIEIAAITGLLHNYYFYKTGIRYFPGINSAESVRPIIRDVNMFSKSEQRIILRAIFYQDQYGKAHGAYDELIKDAIILNTFFQTSDHSVPLMEVPRLHKVFGELSMPKNQLIEVDRSKPIKEFRNTYEDRRSMLADFSEELAKQNIWGIPEDERYIEICQYWPDPDIHKVLVAEGNRDNDNYSSVFRRSKDRNILGYIRIHDEYEFHFDGEYHPSI
ncbi:hypothetical protein HNO89_002797 [Sporosarcina luteola]|nr:hypothetical protein [Sporosarcina luteola]